ncbi:MAG: efflux RND transporter periplasmic adaptor subunit, partial [Hyphomicrobium sp.]
MPRILIATLALFLSLVLPAAAGPGHDHGDGAHGAPVAHGTMLRPRIESTGDTWELVAAADGHALTLYLDDVASNAPVDGATIEVAGDGIGAHIAKALGNGMYEVNGAWVDAPGKTALTFTITRDDTAELLNGTLVVPDTRDAVTPLISVPSGQILQSPLVWLLAVIAAFVGFAASFAVRPLRVPGDTTPAPAAAHESNTAATTVRRERQALTNAAEAIVVVLIASAALTFNTTLVRAHDGEHTAAPDEGAAPAQSDRRTTAAPRGDQPHKLPGGDVFVPKATQRLLAVRTRIVGTESLVTGTDMIGTVISDPSSEGRVQAPMSGQIQLAASGVSFVGQTVKAGDVLAVLQPEIPVYDRGQLQQLTAEIEGKRRIAELKLSRLTRIAGVVAQKDIDDAQADLESLREQSRVLKPKAAETLTLKAPVSGVISVANVRAGQVVSARETLFEIVDPARLWIEAIAPAGTTVGASSASSDGVTIAADALDADGHRIGLDYIGRSPVLRQQSQP